MEHNMSGNNVAHVSSVDKGLKMKIKRTKGPNKVDSKHEVVKTDSLSKSATPSSGQSMVSVAVTMLPSTATSSSPMVSVTTASGSGNSTSFILQTTAPSLLLPPVSSSAILSSSNNTSPSLATMTAANPTVALLKAVTAGIVSEVYSSNSVTAANKSPLKMVPPSTHGADHKDGKSHKLKAAYNKKVKDIKGKPDSILAIGPPCSMSGPHIPNVDNRTCVGLASSSQSLNSSPAHFPSVAGVMNSTVTSEPRPGDTVHMKRENPVHDPYEFNAKVEDKIELPPKKLKLEKAECIETAISPQPPLPQQHSSSPGMLQPPPPPPPPKQQQQHPHKRSVGVDVRSVGVVTEPDALGPCEPGTLVGLEGIVWKETDNGLLVVNVTWRGKTYVGTLMDATRYAWAPPRPNGCESPVSDFEPRAPKGRGKRNCRNSVQSNERLPEGRRLRKGRRGTVNSSSSNFTAPPSPAKSDVSTSNMKRKNKTNDLDSDKHKRSRSCSRGVTGAESPTPDGYIVCPEPNCHKKYKHMNGLRYHRTHAHRKSSLTDDAKDDEEEDEEEEEKPEKKSTALDRTERTKSKERQKVKELQVASGRDSKDSLDDDIPLKEIASIVSGHTSAPKVDDSGTGKDKSEEESSSNSNDGSPSIITAPSVSSKGDPQVILSKTDLHGQKESMSPSIFCAPTPKKKDLNLVDIPISSVPCVSANESLAVVSTDADNMSVPALAAARSRVCSISSTVAEKAVSTQACPTLSAVSAHTLPQNSATGQGSTTALTAVHDITSAAKSSAFMKSTSSARLIVPVPPHQMSGLSNTHSHNMSSVSAMHGHGSTLKPIQPKPTVMGDLSTISPALADLAKEKHRKPKKKKDITETVTLVSSNPCPKGQGSSRDSSSAVSDLPSQNDLYKCERTGVIKSSNPSKTYEDSSPINDLSKLSFQSSVAPHKLQCSLNSETSLTVGARVAVPPSSLPVSSSADSKSTVNDDVHSPAYSDISDANDSSSPLQQDSPKKDSSLKKDGQHNGPTHLGPDNSSLPQHYGNIFYYGGPHYAPHGINSQMVSPTLSDGLIKKENVEEKRPPSSNEHMLDKNDGARCAQEADLQQKSLINYFAHLHGVSPAAMQLQYNLASYNPTPMDSSYSTLAQQALDQQKRLIQHHEMTSKEDGSGKRTPSGTPSTSRPMRSGFDSSGKHNVVADVMEGQYDQRRAGGDRDHTMRDKHGDIHHNLKENHELKSHLGSNSDQQAYHAMKQQHNDHLRVHMYQQQRQKMYESHRQDKRKSPPELTNTGAHIPSSMCRNQPDNKPAELIPHDMIKKEVVHHKDSSRLDAVDSKRFDIKEESIKLGQTASSLDMTSKSRSPSQPNIPQVSSASSSSLSLSTAASLPVSLVGALPSTAAGFPYTPYYPHFRPVQLDSMYRALSPHIIGYASAPQGFIHPTQLGYRMPVVDTDGKSTDTVESLRGDGPGLVNSPGYASTHKIHELHDKGRPSPGVNSPAPSKSVSGDNLSSSERTTPGPPVDKVKDKQREYSSSPPTQRHVHTHHHTHVMSGFPPLYTPDAYTMFGHPAAAAAIQTGPHPFPPPPPPPAPKS